MEAKDCPSQLFNLNIGNSNDNSNIDGNTGLHSMQHAITQNEMNTGIMHHHRHHHGSTQSSHHHHHNGNRLMKNYYILDIQKLDGECFPFLDVCAKLMKALKYLPPPGIKVVKRFDKKGRFVRGARSAQTRFNN